MSPLLFALLAYLAWFVLACGIALAGFFAYVILDSLRDQRRKARRGGQLEDAVFRRVVEEAEMYTREAAR